MLSRIYRVKQDDHGYVCRVAVAALMGAGLLSASLHGDKKKDAMAPMDMSCMADMNGVDMSAMGPSMAAMAWHMYVTPLRPPQPGDVEKAKAVITAVKATVEKYQDYKKAEKDGYVQGNPDVTQPQYHFTNEANTREADLHFDPTRPTSLL